MWPGAIDLTKELLQERARARQLRAAAPKWMGQLGWLQEAGASWRRDGAELVRNDAVAVAAVADGSRQPAQIKLLLG